jgi:hypothetical protein
MKSASRPSNMKIIQKIFLCMGAIVGVFPLRRLSLRRLAAIGGL